MIVAIVGVCVMQGDGDGRFFITAVSGGDSGGASAHGRHATLLVSV